MTNESLRIAKFHKVSFGQFKEAWFDTFGSEDETAVQEIYDAISLPARATSKDAGYDFVSPLDFTLEPGQEIKVPTGIRAVMSTGWYLMCCPKSGLGFKYYVRFANTVGIVDCGYACSDNEGHIFVKLRNEGNKTMQVNQGDKLFQGIFCMHGITVDDDATGERNGGFGSTGR